MSTQTIFIRSFKRLLSRFYTNGGGDDVPGKSRDQEEKDKGNECKLFHSGTFQGKIYHLNQNGDVAIDTGRNLHNNSRFNITLMGKISTLTKKLTRIVGDLMRWDPFQGIIVR